MHNVYAVTDVVTAFLATLYDDYKYFSRFHGWLEFLEMIKGGGVPGKF